MADLYPLRLTILVAALSYLPFNVTFRGKLEPQ